MHFFLFSALCNSKLLSIKTALSTSIGSSQASTDTNKLIFNNYSTSGNVSNKINPFLTCSNCIIDIGQCFVII